MEKSTFIAGIGRIREFCLKPQVFLVLLFLASAVMRLVAWDWAPLLERDSVVYVNAAAVWAETGKYIVPQFPPLPCYLIKLLIQLGMAPEAAARFYSFLPGCLVPPVAYVFAMEALNNRRLARYAAVFCVFHPTLIVFSIMPIRDSLYVLLAGVSLWTGLLALRSRQTRLWILCACCCALAWCCRHEGMELLVLAFLGLAFELFRKRYTWRLAACHFLLFCLIMPAVWFGVSYAAGGAEPFRVQSVLVLNHFRGFIEK